MMKFPPRKKEAVFLADEIEEYLGTIGSQKLQRLSGAAGSFSVEKAQRSMNLLTCWQRVAAPYLLEHTDNVVFSTRSKETEVLVFVDSAAYAAELSMDKELYRVRMQMETNQEITDIKFLVSQRTALRKQKNKTV